MNSISPTNPIKKASYAPLAIYLHWLLAILIVGMIPLGWYMLSIEDSLGSDWYFMLHKSIGIVVSILVLLRLLWRSRHKPDRLPSNFPYWQVMASKITHWLLYAAMITMPFVGIAGAMLSKDDISFFGVPLPRITSPNHDLGEIFFSLHSIIAWVLVALISLHVVAALKHLINKDGVFERMWFSKKQVPSDGVIKDH
ncbi:MAG: cytochrome b [bacterium]|nr:cytochrome b [bacterium]